MSNVSETSREAHRNAILDGRKQTVEAKIYRWLCNSRRGHGWTRNEIAESLGIRINVVCGAVGTLLADSLVVELDKRRDQFSGANAKPLFAVDPSKPRTRPMFSEEEP